jgi:hydrogenase expression/formation protein HypE
MRRAAEQAAVTIVTGDTKVVDRGAADRLFVTTAGIGVIPPGCSLGQDRVRPGDIAIVNGALGDHGAAIMAARGDLALETALKSDSRPLGDLMAALLAAAPGTRCARDATRGGLASAVNEIALAAGVGVRLVESDLPLRPEVRGLCEILGLDPLYLANEGTLVTFVPAAEAEAALDALRSQPAGRGACVIGRAVADHPGTVVMDTLLGGRRIVDMLVGDQLPRIC